MRARERGPAVLLAQITAPHFCAGIGIDLDGSPPRVIDAAPILRFMMGLSAQAVADYCYENGWKIARVKQKDVACA